MICYTTLSAADARRHCDRSPMVLLVACTTAIYQFFAYGLLQLCCGQWLNICTCPVQARGRRGERGIGGQCALCLGALAWKVQARAAAHGFSEEAMLSLK